MMRLASKRGLQNNDMYDTLQCDKSGNLFDRFNRFDGDESKLETTACRVTITKAAIAILGPGPADDMQGGRQKAESLAQGN